MAKASSKTANSNGSVNRVFGDEEQQEPVVKKAATKTISKGVELPQLDRRIMELRLIGEEPLICHRWSEKAKKQMLDKQMGVATAGKESRGGRF